MKSVFIVFNQAFTSRVEYMLDELGIRGFTFFEQVQGRGSVDGEPRRGTHTWPEMNSAVITIVPGRSASDGPQTRCPQQSRRRARFCLEYRAERLIQKKCLSLSQNLTKNND